MQLYLVHPVHYGARQLSEERQMFIVVHMLEDGNKQIENKRR